MDVPDPIRVADVSLAFRDVSGECDLVINHEGLFATPAQKQHEHLQPIEHAVDFPWGAIAAVERRHGMAGWRLFVRLKQGAEPVVLQFLYENHPASIFLSLRERFGDRAEFRSTAQPMWKPLLVPLCMLAFVIVGGWWVYANIEEHVRSGGEMPVVLLFLYRVFGRHGILAFLAVAVAICLGMAAWYYRLSRDDN